MSTSRNSSNPKRSRSLILSGLSSRTTQAMCEEAVRQFLPMEVSLRSEKGYAFVNFDTVEKAVALMDAFGGSCGDRDGAQLIVCDRAVRLSFARERPQNKTNSRKSPKVWNDWICPKCNTTNFARRVKCFSCSASKPADATIVQASVVAESKATEATIPTNSIVVRNMKLSTTEDTIHKVLSNFAPVKEVRLIRDRVTNESRGFAFVDFYTIEQAEHCMKAATDLRVDGALVTLNFSKGERRMKHVSNEFATVQTVSQQQQQQHSVLDDATILAYRKRKEEKMYSKFPLPFESAGTDYTFDPNTEQYYESVHGFYFDPKTKYYYSAMEGVYYVYDNVSKTFSSVPVAKPSEWQAVFDPNSQQYYYYNSVTQRTSWTCPSGFSQDTPSSSEQTTMTAPPPPTTNDVVVPTTVASSSTSPPPPQNTLFVNNSVSTFGLNKQSKNLVAKKIRGSITKSKIAIFNTNNEEDEEEKKTEDEMEALRLQAQRAQGQSRLHERRDRQIQVQETLKRQEELAQVKREKLDMVKRIQQEKEKLRKLVSSNNASSKPASAALAKNKFICWVCRRSFKSEDMLTKHELESELHKKNLAAQKKDGATKYVDRAAQRRKMYGQPNRPPPTKKRRRVPLPDQTSLFQGQLLSKQPSSGKRIEKVEIDESNVGRKMLEKIGWKKGEGLGKHNDGIKAPINHSEIGGKMHASDMRGVGSNKRRRRK